MAIIISINISDIVRCENKFVGISKISLKPPKKWCRIEMKTTPLEST